MTRKPQTTYVAFQNSEKLWKNNETFIRNIRAKSKISQTPVLVEVMHDFLDEVMDVFIVQLCEVIKLQGTPRKLLNLAVSTVKKTCHFLSRKVLQKMKNNDVEELAEYMDKLMVVMPNQGGEQAAFTAIPLSDELADRMLSVIHKVSTGKPSDQVDELIDILIDLRDVVSLYLYQNTLDRLTVGRIARTLIETSYITVKKATQTPIAKVVPNLSDEQLVASADYLKDMILEGPPHKEIYG